MEMLWSVLLFAVGLVLLIKGGDWFVDGATGIAKRFNLPDIVVGATVVSIGTTLPEVMVSTTGALAGSGAMAYGNAIGSIICNTALIAAISITCNPGPVNVKSMKTPALFFFASAGLYCLASYVLGTFPRWMGFVMLGIFVVYTVLTVRNGLKNPDEAEEEEEEGGKEKSMLMLLILPQLIESIAYFASNYHDYLASAIHQINLFLEKLNALFARITDNDSLFGYLDEQTLNQLFTNTSNENGFINYFSNLSMETVTAAIQSLFSRITDVIFGLFISLYLLSTKELRYAQVMKVRRALFSDYANTKITRFCTVADRAFGSFWEGKLIDSLIVCVMIYVPLAIFKVPYALLISVFIAVTNIIPSVGILIGTIPTALIILLTDPGKTIPFLVIVILVQQIDNNIISPKILGSNTGISSLCVLISITVMGALGGWIGLLLAVPLFATLLEMLDEWTVHNLQKKGLPTGTESYYAPDAIIDPDRDDRLTTDKTLQRILSVALTAQKKRERGEKLSFREAVDLRMYALIKRMGLNTELPDTLQIAAEVEEVTKAAATEAAAEWNARRSATQEDSPATDVSADEADGQ